MGCCLEHCCLFSSQEPNNLSPSSRARISLTGCVFFFFTLQKSERICPFVFCLTNPSHIDSVPSPPEEEESTDVCQEKPDLRLRHGVHHQCDAHRGQSDAAERHGVTAYTVSTGSGENSHDLTSCTCSQSWTSHNQSTSRISAMLLFWKSFSFLFFVFSLLGFFAFHFRSLFSKYLIAEAR